MNKINVAAVRYLNTKPLLYGIRQHPVMEEIHLIEDYPARIAQLLIDGKVDVGLVPVAVIPRLKAWHIITDYCIGADGAVASVCLFSEVPIHEIQKIYLDYQSRTSVRLAKILVQEYWKLDVEFIDASGEDYRNEIKGTVAGVVIGDRALEQRKKSTYIYDLGEAWKAHTGLPFVFAAWIANKELPTDFIQNFNEANGIGLHHIPQIVTDLNYPHYNLQAYFTRCIDYNLNQQKRKGLALFLEKIERLQL